MRMSQRRLAAAAATVGLALVPAGAVAAPAKSGHRAGGHRSQGQDHHARGAISAQAFLTKAAQANRFEIVSGQLAQTRAASAEVKALGAMFVAHHTDLLAKGSAVAAQLGIAVPEGLSPRQQATVDALQQLSGDAFDHAWLRAQIAAHRQALGLALRGAIRGDRPEIRTLAQGALPVITMHYGELLDLWSGAGEVQGSDQGDDQGNDQGDDGGHHHGDQRR
jgi:putative membrane protein